MEIGGLRVVASPVRVHWGREGRSEVRVPDGGGRGCPLSLGSEACRRGRSADGPRLPTGTGARPSSSPPCPAPCATPGRRLRGEGLLFSAPAPTCSGSGPLPPGGARGATARDSSPTLNPGLRGRLHSPGGPSPPPGPARPGAGQGCPAGVGVFLAPSAGAGLLVGGVTAALRRGACCPPPPPCSSYAAPRAPPGACSAVRVSSGLQAALLSDAASLCPVPGGPALCCLC